MPDGRLYAYADGASRGNPGQAGAGWVLCRGDEAPFAAGNLYLGHRTNNEAEYLAASCALQAALELKLTSLVLRADSELLVRQLAGIYQVRNARLRPLFAQLKALSARFVGFSCEHVPRARNALADAQANLAIDQHLAAQTAASRPRPAATGR